MFSSFGFSNSSLPPVCLGAIDLISSSVIDVDLFSGVVGSVAVALTGSSLITRGPFGYSGIFGGGVSVGVGIFGGGVGTADAGGVFKRGTAASFLGRAVETISKASFSKNGFSTLFVMGAFGCSTDSFALLPNLMMKVLVS